MRHGLGNIRRVHTPQHFRQVRDRSPTQQLLNRLNDNVRLGLPPLGLIAKNLAQDVAIGGT